MRPQKRPRCSREEGQDRGHRANRKEKVEEEIIGLKGLSKKHKYKIINIFCILMILCGVLDKILRLKPVGVRESKNPIVVTRNKHTII